MIINLMLIADITSIHYMTTFKWTGYSTAVLYQFEYDSNADYSYLISRVSNGTNSRRQPAIKVGSYFEHHCYVHRNWTNSLKD